MIDYYLGFSVLVQQGNVHYLAIYVVLKSYYPEWGGGGGGEKMWRARISQISVSQSFLPPLPSSS